MPTIFKNKMSLKVLKKARNLMDYLGSKSVQSIMKCQFLITYRLILIMALQFKHLIVLLALIKVPKSILTTVIMRHFWAIKFTRKLTFRMSLTTILPWTMSIISCMQISLIKMRIKPKKRYLRQGIPSLIAKKVQADQRVTSWIE